MQYMGSKNRVAKDILPVILKDRRPEQWYVEPFCGGCNSIDKVDGKRLANDSHPYLIDMWIALQKGWVPPSSLTKEEYYSIKKTPSLFRRELVGFAGFLCSFGSKWWGGYAFNNKGDNYADRGSRMLVKQVTNLVGVFFTNEHYGKLVIPPKSIVYCDPPYENSTAYSSKFNHTEFWAWVRLTANKGHTVFVSEYTAPPDFKCVLELQHKTILDKNSQYPRTERLFTL
jgi:DNA adenine methylase